MSGRQYTCLILEQDPARAEILCESARAHGFRALSCDGLFKCEICNQDPDAVIFGSGALVSPDLEHISNVELLIRETQTPVLAPPELKEQLLEHFDDIYTYSDADTISEMLFPLVYNHARRLNIRNDMILAMEGIHYIDQAEFSFKTLEEAQALALLLSSFAPEKRILRLGLTELFVNAVEHGNLKISKVEKEELRQKGEWLSEVEKRLTLDEFKDKEVRATIKKDKNQVSLRIEDQGDGFDWQSVFANAGQGLTTQKKSGRGLFIVKKTGLDRIQFVGAGNIVDCSFTISSHEVPHV